MLIAGSGLASAIIELTAVSQLWSTGYGRAISVKTVLFVVLIVLGWMNRKALGDPARLRRSVRVELVLLALVVVAVAVLTSLRPGRDVSSAPGRTWSARLRLRPHLRAGRSSSAARCRSSPSAFGAPGHAAPPDGDGDRSVGLRRRRTRRAALGSLRRGRPTVAAEACGHGCYAVSIPRAHPTAFGVALRGDGVPRSIVFPVRQWPPPLGTPFLQRANRAFSGLQSVVYREHLASDPAHAITTLWTLEAPGSVEYTIAGGAQGIVIGRRRWDRPSRTAPWTLSPRTDSPSPLRRGGALPGRSGDGRDTCRRDALVGRSGDPGVVHGDLHRAKALPSTLQMTARRTSWSTDISPTTRR